MTNALRNKNKRLVAMHKVLMSCLIVATLAACTSAETTYRGEDISDTTWLTEDIRGGGVIDYAQTTLHFESVNQVVGRGGCNTYTTSVTLEPGDRISFGPIASTRKMCSTALMDQETKFFAALSEVTNYTVDAYLLVLYNDDATPLIRLSATAND